MVDQKLDNALSLAIATDTRVFKESFAFQEREGAKSIQGPLHERETRDRTGGSSMRRNSMHAKEM